MRENSGARSALEHMWIKALELLIAICSIDFSADDGDFAAVGDKIAGRIAKFFRTYAVVMIYFQGQLSQNAAELLRTMVGRRSVLIERTKSIKDPSETLNTDSDFWWLLRYLRTSYAGKGYFRLIGTFCVCGGLAVREAQRRLNWALTQPEKMSAIDQNQVPILTLTETLKLLRSFKYNDTWDDFKSIEEATKDLSAGALSAPATKSPGGFATPSQPARRGSQSSFA